MQIYLKGFTTLQNSTFSDTFYFRTRTQSQFHIFDTEVFHKINHYGSIRNFYPKHLDFSTLKKK